MDRNFLMFAGLSMAAVLIWGQFVIAPQQKAQRAEAARIQAEQQANAPTITADGKTEATGSNSAVTDLVAPKSSETKMDLADALAAAPGRVQIETPALSGSINLKGAQIDDLRLKEYRETTDKDSPLVTVLRPVETGNGHLVRTGWILELDKGEGQKSVKDTENLVWRAAPNAVLTPETPVTLSRIDKDGTVYEMDIAVDDQFMFTVTQRVTNKSGAVMTANAYASAVQYGFPDKLKNSMILHEGPIAEISDKLHFFGFKPGQIPGFKGKREIQESGTGGWVGLTQKYWFAAAIPQQDKPFKASLKNHGTKEKPIFYATYVEDPVQVANGDTVETTSYLFAGAKRVKTLRGYQSEDGLGIQDFDKAVDWGNFFFLTRPIFMVLEFFGNLTGNYGVAILLLTLSLKVLLFWLANKSYASMARMKKVQPQMTALRERYKDDNMGLQKEMMALYKKEKVNPMAGCLPIIVQMPIFYALYKTLFVTIEIRHQGFLYISDLSAPDPAMLLNLFGLIPWNPASVPVLGTFLAIGILPLLMGFAMFVQTKLNPPPADPMQQQIFALMPWMFMFIMSPFAAGLVLYWFWNTFLGVVQQYVIMKRNGADVDLFSNLLSTFKRKPKDGAAANDK